MINVSLYGSVAEEPQYEHRPFTEDNIGSSEVMDWLDHNDYVYDEYIKTRLGDSVDVAYAYDWLTDLIAYEPFHRYRDDLCEYVKDRYIDEIVGYYNERCAE